MNTILALIDFTETSKKALEQAAEIAHHQSAGLKLCHIMHPKTDESTVRKDMEEYLKEAEARGLDPEMVIERGDFMIEVQEVVKRLKPKLVVVGTHGKSGWKQNLLGSTIYKLVKLLPITSLVINDDFKTVAGGFKKILLPVAPHGDYLTKVKQSLNLLAPEGKIEIFTIVKPGVDLDQKTQDNIEASRQFLEEQNTNWEHIEVESTGFSVGYSRESLTYALANQVDLIGIMARVSEDNKSFGTMDKENILLNKDGIAILCTN